MLMILPCVTDCVNLGIHPSFHVTFPPSSTYSSFPPQTHMDVLHASQHNIPEVNFYKAHSCATNSWNELQDTNYLFKKIIF